MAGAWGRYAGMAVLSLLLAGTGIADAAKRIVPMMRMEAVGEAPTQAPAAGEAPTLDAMTKGSDSKATHYTLAPTPSFAKAAEKVVLNSPGSKYDIKVNFVEGPDGERYALPLPQSGRSTRAVPKITDQPYLGGGNMLPTNAVTESGERPAGSATARQTAGHKLIAPVAGGKLPPNTGVSTIAVPVGGRNMSRPKSEGELADSPEEGAASQGPMRYHWGGAVLANPTVYLIFYGSWLCNNYAGQKCVSDYGTPSVIRDFVIGMGGSPWMNIVSSYTDGAGTAIPNTLSFGDDTFVSKGQPCFKGETLSDSDVFDIVTCVLDAKALPYKKDGMYLVISSGEVKETSGFCSAYCGWHAHDTWGAPVVGSNVRYGFVGSPNQCPKGCMKQRDVSPNSIPEADGMVSIVGHEIVEVITDPDANAWFDDNGAENADKCSWKYGDTQTAGNAKFNSEFACSHDKCSEWARSNKRKYLIQQNWVHKLNGGYCASQA